MKLDNTLDALGVLVGSQIFLLTFTIGIYVLSLWLFRRTRVGLLHPLITSAAVIIVFLLATGISYDQYHSATALIDFMLGPSVVALGYALYRQVEQLRANAVSIVSVAMGLVLLFPTVCFLLGVFVLSLFIDIDEITPSPAMKKILSAIDTMEVDTKTEGSKTQVTIKYDDSKFENM